MNRQLSIIIFASRDSEAELREVLKNVPRLRVVAASDQTEQAYAEIVHWRPSAVIISLDKHPEAGLMLCRQINSVCPETVAICASRSNSPDVILDSLRAGSKEFLRLPVNHEELMTVLNRIGELSTGDSQAAKKRGRVIAVFSNKGGSGTSFVAANLSIALGAPTVLVDLNLQAGSLDLFFGVKPKYSIVDLVENRERLDDQMLAGYLVPHSSNLSILAAPQDIEEADRLKPEQVLETIDLLRTRFDYVVLDLPHTFDPLTIGALDQADDILLLLTLDILASRAAQRAITIFYRLGYDKQKIRLVLNRWSKQSDLELRHVERFLGERITCFISDDYRAVVNSINVGRPLMTAAQQTPVIAEFKHLAALCGSSEAMTAPATRRNLLSVIFNRNTGALKAPTTQAEENPAPVKLVTAKLR